MYICEEQKWDLEREVRKRDYEVQNNSSDTTVFLYYNYAYIIHEYTEKTFCTFVVYRHCFSRIYGTLLMLEQRL